MGRKALPEQRILISSRVTPRLKKIIDTLAAAERRNVSQVVEILIEESPRVVAETMKNGKGKK